MTNEELLQELSTRVADGSLAPEAVRARFQVVSPVSYSSRFSLTKLLYIIGGAVVMMGIIFFIAQIWEDIGSFGRIFVTLVFGLILAGIGSFFLRTKSESHLGEVFHLIGGFLIPGGALVTLNETIGLSALDSLWPVVIVFGLIFTFYLLLNLYHRSVVLTFFTIGNGTTFLYLLVEAITDGSFYQHGELYAYLTMITGLSYLLLTSAFRSGWNQQLVSVLNFLGSVSFFTAAFSRVSKVSFWEFLFFVFTVGGLAFAVYIRNRIILFVSALFLVAHLIYITNEYFADSIGWPISLVILGFLFIGLGYFSITISKKYISS